MQWHDDVYVMVRFDTKQGGCCWRFIACVDETKEGWDGSCSSAYQVDYELHREKVHHARLAALRTLSFYSRRCVPFFLYVSTPSYLVAFDAIAGPVSVGSTGFQFSDNLPLS